MMQKYPGEYNTTNSDTSPFTLADVQLFIGSICLHLHQASESECTLEFTTHKYGVQGKVVGLGRSADFRFCPIMSEP